MKRLSLIIVSAVLAMALMFGTLAVNQVPQAHAATIPAHTSAAHMAGSSTQTTTISNPSQALIQKANPYIHVTNYIATIDPTISHVLSPTELAQVRQAVQHYNALPISTKKSAPTKPITSNIVPNTSCPSGSGAVYGPFYYWWGQAYTLDHCLISQLWSLAIAGATGEGLIALICGIASAGVCAFIAGAAGLAIAGYIGALQGADAQCGDRGANLNFTSNNGPIFVNTVC